MWWIEITFYNYCFVVVFWVLHQQLMQLFQSIMRNRSIHMVRKVIILPHWENGKVDESIDQKGSRIGKPTAIAISVLNPLAEDHKERKRCEKRHNPQQEKVERYPMA